MDEFDQLLNDTICPDIEAIIKFLPDTRKTLFFSANKSHLEWIKKMPNALYTHHSQFYNEYIILRKRLKRRVMKNYSILGTKPQTISPISRSFIILNRGRATITLNPDGVVTTFSATVPEGTIKRDSQYKSVLYELSEQMIKAYEAQTLTFLQLHRKLKKTIYSKKSYENKIDKIEKKIIKQGELFYVFQNRTPEAPV